MRKVETTVTQKGQVTIPQEIRARLKLKPKDKVIFEMEGEVARLRKAPSKVQRWYGAVPASGKPEDLKKVREEFEAAVAEEVISEDQEER